MTKFSAPKGHAYENPDLPKLLRAIADGPDAKTAGTSAIFNAAADELDRHRARDGAMAKSQPAPIGGARHYLDMHGAALRNALERLRHSETVEGTDDGYYYSHELKALHDVMVPK